MGKTKTAFVGETLEEAKPRKKKVKKEEKSKVRVPGLGGGERVVAVKTEIPAEDKGQESEDKKDPISPRRTTKATRGRGKKYKDASVKVDKNKLYPTAEAVDIVKQTSYSAFDGTVELHLLVKKEGLSTKVELPHSTGKSRKVEIATDDTIKKLEDGKIDFDVLLATAEVMPRLVPFARILGPKGLMPNPKAGTLIKNKKEATKFSGNTLNLKTEKKIPLIHTSVGKVSQKDSQLAENVEAVITAIGPKQVTKAYLTSTMGPSVKLALN